MDKLDLKTVSFSTSGRSKGDELYNNIRKFKRRDKEQQNNPILSTIIVDKLRTIIQSTVRGDIEAVIYLLKNAEGKLKIEVKEHAGRYSFVAVLSLPSNDPSGTTTTMWIGQCAKTGALHVHYCPAKVSDLAHELLDADIFSLTRFGTLPNFLARGKVTRIDLCYNLFNVDIESYLFRGSWFRHYGCFFGSDGKLETMYFGLMNGSRISVYDKKKEDEDNYLKYSHVVRVEHQIKPPNQHVYDLHELANPFDRAEIYMLDLSGLDCVPDAFLGCFLDSCRVRGFANAIDSLGLPENKSKKALRQLKEVPWRLWLEKQENWKSEWAEALRTYRLVGSDSNEAP